MGCICFLLGLLVHEMAGALLERLRARGDFVEINCGCLIITPISNRPVPPEWLKKNERRLIAEAAEAANTLALEYLGYSTGNYVPGFAGGVTLQFRCMVSGQELHTIFNAKTRRSRTTKHGNAGDSLPKGRFQVGKGSAFLRFWLSTGLPMHRLSDFHDYMGNLGKLIYTGSVTKGGRLDKATLHPLTLNLPDNPPTTSRQAPDKAPTRFSDKESSENQQQHGFQPNQTTWQEKYGNTVTRKCGHTASVTPPESQTTEEWLADYSAA